MTVTRSIHQHAETSPGHPALVVPDGPTLSYAQLATQIRNLAAALQGQGVEADHTLGIVLPDGPEAVVTFLAVTEIAAAAPLNPALRHREFAFEIEDLGLTAMIVGSASSAAEAAAAAARDHGIPVIRVGSNRSGDGFALTINGEAPRDQSPATNANGHDVALVLHTSGTTARPKIVPLTHNNLLASMNAIIASVSLQPTDRVCNVMPLFHVHGLVGAVCSSLVAGATVICPPGFSAADMGRWLRETGATWYTAVPTIHQALLQRRSHFPHEFEGVNLRFVRSASSSLAPVVMAELESMFGCPVIEAYGMTEAAPSISSNPLPPAVQKPGSVGLPAGPEIAIMGPGGEQLSVGEVGEVVIRGSNVMGAYRDNAAANTESFSNGWFRTGDQGYLDDDGYLFLTGRLKELINRGGEKVSPREVDELLLTHPGVAQAVTFGVKDKRLGEQVAAAVVRSDASQLSERDLRQYCSERLAPYKVPRRIVFLDTIPKGPSGKLRRLNLADEIGLTELDSDSIGAVKRDPQGETEEMLAQLWCEALGVDHVGAQDRFLDVGGDSLAGARLLERVQDLFDVELSLLDFFDAHTIAEQADLIGGAVSPNNAAAWCDHVEPEAKDAQGPLVDSLYRAETFAGLGDAPARPDLRQRGSRTATFPLTANQMATISDLAAQEDTVPFVVALAAVELTTRDFFGAEDFATTCMHRLPTESSTARVDRQSINPIFVRSSLGDPALSAGDFVRAVRDSVADSLESQVPSVSDSSTPSKDWDLVDQRSCITLEWSDDPRTEPASPKPTGQGSSIALDDSHGLAVLFEPGVGGDGSVHITYDGGELGLGDVEAFFARLCSHLRRLGTDKNRPVGIPVPVTGPAPAATQLEIEPVVATVETQARAWPDTAAVRSPEGLLSYRQLWERSGRVANALTARGATAKDTIALVGPDCPGYLVALLGIWRLGATAALEHAIPSTGATSSVAIQVGAGTGSQDDHSGPIALDRLGAGPTHTPTLQSVRQDRNRPAIVGAGQPGWSVSHAQLSSLTLWLRNRVGLRPGSVVAVPDGPGLRPSPSAMLLPLISGATLSFGERRTEPHQDETSEPDVVVHNAASARTAARQARHGNVDRPAWLILESSAAGAEFAGSWATALDGCTRVLLVEDDPGLRPQGGSGAVVLTELGTGRDYGATQAHPAIGYQLNNAPIWPGESGSLTGQARQLSNAQERLWIVEQSNPGTADYTVHFCEQLDGELDLDALLRAITAVRARHEALRSRVVLLQGQPQLCVDPPSALHAQIHNLTSEPPSEQAVQCDALLADLVSQPFDIGAEALMRIHVIRLDPNRSVLCLLFHHLVVDGGSAQLFYDELSACYRAYTNDTDPDLPAVPASYVDYAADQRRTAANGGFAKELAYWQEALRPPLPERSLGTDTGGDPRDAVLVERPLAAETITSMRSVARDAGATPFMLGLRVLAGLVRNETGEDETVVSMVAGEHSWPHTESAIGYFVNTVPLRLGARGQNLDLNAVRSAVLGAFMHSQVPLDLILDQAGLSGPAATKLIDGLEFEVLDQAPRTLDLGPGLSHKAYPPKLTVAKFELSIQIAITDGAGVLRVVGRASRFEEKHLAQLAAKYENALLDYLSNGESQTTNNRVSAAPVPSVAATSEEAAPLSGPHQGDVRATGPQNQGGRLLLPERLWNLATQRPNQIVLEQGDESISTAQLVELAGRYAAELAALGVQAGDRIALDAWRSTSTIAAMYAAWWLGAAYVPIDAAAPATRNHKILQHADVSAVVSTRDQAQSGIDRAVWLDPKHNTNPVPRAELDSSTPAYVIFTSGTSGTPKGVEIGHGAVSAFVDAASLAYDFRPGDKVLQFHSLAFDGSVEEVHVPLAMGGVSVLRPEDLLGSLRPLLQFVDDHRITQLSLPTALWHEIVAQLTSETKMPATLRNVVIGGEAARTDAVASWYSHLSNGRSPRLINSYGPTEGTVVALSAVLDAQHGQADIVPIGQPLDQVRAMVADDNGIEVDRGEWGELWLAGAQLALGYLNNPTATAAAFVDVAGTRWYRTGDRARQQGDGQFVVSGRLDNQVKVDGHRIEIDEVERAAHSLPAVQNAAVVVVDDAGAVQLELFVVANRPIDIVVLRRDLAQLLPAAMIPKFIQQVEVIPTNVNGKIDRSQLARLAESRVGQEIAESAAVPADKASPSADADIASRLVAVWEELLHCKVDGADADFFALGGRSLTAVRMAFMVEEAFGIEFGVANVFEHPVLSDMVDLIADLVGVSVPAAPSSQPEPTESQVSSPLPGAADVPAPPPVVDTPPLPVPAVPVPLAPKAVGSIPAGANTDASPAPSNSRGDLAFGWPATPARLHLDRAPLSASQESLWLHGQIRSEDLPYLIPSVWRVRGPLEESALEATLTSLARRHEALRTRIVVDLEGKPQQVIDPPEMVRDVLTVTDLAHVRPAERDEHARALCNDASRRPIDIAREHPLRALLVRCSPDDHYLAVIVHHLASDDQTMDALISEIGDRYGQIVAGKAPEEAPPRLQYSDFAVWQRARLKSGVLDRSLEYWRNALGQDPRPIELPGRRTNANPGGTIHNVPVDLSRHTAQKLLEQANGCGVSPFQLSVALAAMLFQRLSRDPVTVIGTPRSERTQTALEDVVGLFVNTIMLPVPADNDATFADLLKTVRRVTGASLSHGDVPLDALVAQLGLPQTAGSVPLISVMCQFHNHAGHDGPQLGGLDVSPVAEAHGDVGLVADLMIYSRVDEQGHFSVSLGFDDQVLEPWVIRQLAATIEHLAEQVIAEPGQTLGQLELVSPSELRWQLDNGTVDRRPFPHHERVEAVVEARASEDPAATAVIDANRTISYGELIEEATDVAHQLTRLGVREGSIVACRLERSVELVVAMLGILKAKAVYLPIDSASPPERTRTVLDVAGASAVISTQGSSLQIETLRGTAPIIDVDKGEPAYVMFTSGSTGVPKGVIVPHVAIQRLVNDMIYAPVSRDSVVAMASNPAFDALTFEVWGALANGARIQVLDADTLAKPKAFARALESGSVSTMFLTTSLANLVAAEVPDAFGGLDTLIVGGEALDPDSMRRILENGPKRLVNGYGPTECTTFSSYYLIEDVAPGATSIPIGFPVPNTGLHVLDPDGAALPAGVAGELYVSGPGLAIGYLGDSDLTAARFVTRNVAGESVRMYRTGDRVRRGHDGAIEYLGRVDHQIKLRGFRIELGEIESALLAQDSVLSAVALVVGEGAARRLAAFAVCDDDVDPGDLKRQLAQQIPAYMVPSSITVLDALPLTPSGKADRQKLFDLAAVAPGPVTESSEAPEDPQLAAMLALWADVLGTGDIGPDSDFFEAGGNSLLAIELLTLLEQRFGAEIPLSGLFKARTPRDLLGLTDSSTVVAGSTEQVVQLRGASLDAPPPLWLIHPAGGSLVLYEPMVSHLGGSNAVLGIEAPGVDGAVSPLEDIAALADRQVDAMLATQPVGPYRILGYSVGGILGIEVTRRLMARGHVVEFLGAVEAGIPSPDYVELTRRQKYGRLVAKREFKAIVNELVSSVQRRKERAAIHVAERGTLAENHRRVAEAMARAFHAYQPKPLDVHLVLFLGDANSDEENEKLTAMWAEIAAGGVTFRQVGGSHDNDEVLREPNAKILARAVELELKRCEDR